MCSAIGKDLPAYVTATGNPAAAKGINTEGLKRPDFSREAIAEIRKAYKIIYRQGLTIDEALQQLRVMLKQYPEVGLLIDSLEQSKRGIVR